MKGELSHMKCHIAVRVGHCVVVIGGEVHNYFQDTHKRSVWSYNLYLEQWRKCLIPENKQVPDNFIGACGVVIGEVIYTFGGKGVLPGSVSNELWKLTQNTDGTFDWTRILVKHKKNTPCPRIGHSGWTYDGKLWTFGGDSVGHYEYIYEYLNEYGDFRNGCNNQLLHFNPVSHEWTNLKCFGTVPSPREFHATAAGGDTVWLYGGYNLDVDFDDFYQLDMCSLTWTQIQTSTPNPGKRFACSLNVTKENQLVLHGGNSDGSDILEDTWVLDLSSYSWKCTDTCSYRSYHTGSLGINNSILIIGGYNAKYINNFRLEPESLKQLSDKDCIQVSWSASVEVSRHETD